MTRRPQCTRCHGALDLCIDYDYDTESYRSSWECRNGFRRGTDAEFWSEWERLPAEDQTRLEREAEAKEAKEV